MNTFILSLTGATKIFNSMFNQFVLIPSQSDLHLLNLGVHILHVLVTNLIAHQLRLLCGNINPSTNETFSWENLDTLKALKIRYGRNSSTIFTIHQLRKTNNN